MEINYFSAFFSGSGVDELLMLLIVVLWFFYGYSVIFRHLGDMLWTTGSKEILV